MEGDPAHALPPLIVSATLTVGVAILFQGGLSFLGLDDPNTMSWGLMIGANRQYILDAWWPVTFPGAAIFLTVFAVSLVGDGLNDAFNPNCASADMPTPLLSIRDLQVEFSTRHGRLTASTASSLTCCPAKRSALWASPAAASRSPRSP